MKILQILGLLQLLSPALTLTQPVNDYWGEFGAYGPCSRTCGTGVAMRIRRCITSRTDGGHNCVGSSKSFLTCNTQACPVGSRDFREEQCSEFDRMDFQGKRHSWVPYYGASNLCELNCVPVGQNFFYRHRPKVVDGTPCYVGRTDICVDGVCRLLVHGEFMGLDNDTVIVESSAPVAVSPNPRETHMYMYRAGVYGECSASCDGGMQYRSVECLVQDPSNPRVVDESYCIAQRLQRPQSQQACNMHPCAAAEYSVSSFSVCSVTCGEGQQTREVVCVGSRGEHLPDNACRGLARPASVQTCRRPACHRHISWHVTEFGLCSRSCGGGVRERKIGCFDTDLNVFPEDQCGLDRKPISVETCNSQPCDRAQLVPSIQNSSEGRSTIRFVPHVPGEQSGPPCMQSSYGCCPDGHTPATGPRNHGCTLEDCINSRFGCCLDGVTPARGFGMAGCPEYQTPGVYESNSVHSSSPIAGVPRPRETLTYVYIAGAYGECSATCNGGVQYRSVDCMVQDASNPRLVDESHCIALRLQRPESQQPCNMHPCAAAEYSVSSFSVCSVTCGEGLQTREVVCVGLRGEHLPDHACRGLPRPAAVQTCRRPACYRHISWHVTEFGLCTRSCGGGVRERKVGCFDTDLNPYPEDQCEAVSRPLSVESCNVQPCPAVQMVPSVQNPGAGGSPRRFVPHVPDPLVLRPETHRELPPYPPVYGPHCAQSFYGCCPDGHTSATGPRYQGCQQNDCNQSRYGCCLDGVTPAQGVGRAGCPAIQTTELHPGPTDPPTQNVCFLPRDEGPCDTWMVRFTYDNSTGKCKEFWYGGCQGNANNFISMEACKKVCDVVVREPAPAREASRRGSLGSIARARAQRSRLERRA
ncbi:PREDICTED: papilin-like [Cyprinodon variegatus]|uniref:Papilin b, proteoglycan-like sulfated glycoprotein n=1 Tax=Cyprinodon variegatus TaxID=28743 RepID=A0A3Q2C858_CYPVA|nr:PREDICTED: papilin-like [Cyprinodon variegatus]